MIYKVGDVVKTKKSPRIFGYVTDVIFVDETNKIIPQIFFEDSDEPEWCYKESYDIIENKRDIRYMTFLYNDWRNENV